MNTNDSYDIPDRRSTLACFFSQRTVEGRSITTKFNRGMVEETLKFESYFTEDDILRVLTCVDAKQCLYVVAEIIGRIRSEQPIYFHVEKTREQIRDLL